MTLTEGIRKNLMTIYQLYHPAQLITERLANASYSDVHGKPSQPPEPVRYGDLDTLEALNQWIINAGSAEQIPRDQTLNLIVSGSAKQAISLIYESADMLAMQADGLRWFQESDYYADSLRKICGIHNTTLVWRAALVDWKPEQIADLLTELTGTPIKADRIRHCKLDGRIRPTREGKVILGEIANALKTTRPKKIDKPKNSR